MNSTEEQDLVKVLGQLISKIKKEIFDVRSKGMIKPEEELYYRWKIDKFQYTKNGVTESSAHAEPIMKKSWWRAALMIEESIKKSHEYFLAVEVLSKIFHGRNTITHDLDCLLRKVISLYLEETAFNETYFDVLISNFLKEIKEEPLRYMAEVELNGIVLIPEKIEYKIGDTDVALRQTKIEDLEKEFPANRIAGQPFLRTPSAILNLEFLGQGDNELQIKILQTIAVLRLFKVGSVKTLSYCMHSDSITNLMASTIHTAVDSERALEISQIINEDEQKLKRFWQIMIKALPSNFYTFEDIKIDYITIAYKRYCDALLQNGSIERRIANAVMGLESLFLKGGEIQELLYRLSIRVSKIFNYLEYDYCKVKEVVEEAYKVRNLFVHGSYLSYNEKKKLNSKFGDARKLLLSLLDYLRISILVMILVKMEKEEFLDLIDDSLVDKGKDNQLNNILNTARNVI